MEEKTPLHTDNGRNLRKDAIARRQWKKLKKNSHCSPTMEENGRKNAIVRLTMTIMQTRTPSVRIDWLKAFSCQELMTNNNKTSSRDETAAQSVCTHGAPSQYVPASRPTDTHSPHGSSLNTAS